MDRRRDREARAAEAAAHREARAAESGAGEVRGREVPDRRRRHDLNDDRASRRAANPTEDAVRGEPTPVELALAGRQASPGLDTATALEVLVGGRIDVLGRVVDASNVTLYGIVTRECPDPEPDMVVTCVYKPIRGERPLADFPDGTLAYREVAAYAVSTASGWNVVPPTVLRDGPYGPGMVQYWIDVDSEADVVGLLQRDDASLRPIAVLDAVLNNADRKGGHLLPVAGGHVFGVDHGVCFATTPKLRTVLWGWRGQPLSAAELGVLTSLRESIDGELGTTLRRLLAPSEVNATRRRLDRLLATKRFPHPDPNWPAVPWPPF